MFSFVADLMILLLLLLLLLLLFLNPRFQSVYCKDSNSRQIFRSFSSGEDGNLSESGAHSTVTHSKTVTWLKKMEDRGAPDLPA